MKFLYPQFLWALFALAVPLIIHLFNFRRYTTVYFSDTRLLQNVVKQSKAINRLKQLLIMLARMLALALLVLAFTNPYIPAPDSVAKPGQYASLYIDNSPSMLSGPQQTSSLSMARSKAVEVIKGLPQNYKIQILTNDFKGRQQRYYTKAEAIELVDEIQPSYAFRTAEDIILKMKQASEDEQIEQLESFFISDFQSSVFSEIPTLPQDWRISLLPVTASNEGYNIAIDSVWFENPVLQPGFDQELQVQLSHSGGDESREVSVNLNIENALQGARKVDVPVNGTATAGFTIRSEKAANYRGQISIDAGSPYFDNKFYFSYSVSEPFRILLTGSEDHRERFTRLFSDSIYRLSYSDITALDYSQLSNFDLVILDAPGNVPTGLIQSLQQNLESGKNVVLTPPEEDPAGISSTLLNLGLPAMGPAKASAKAIEVQWNDPHFSDVFTSKPDRPSLPQTKTYFTYDSRSGYPLISLEDGNPLVSRLPVGQGDVILITAPLSESGLLNHPIFVPTMLNAALYSRQNSALYTLAGKSSGPAYQGTAEEEPLHIQIEDRELIPRQRNRGEMTELYNLSPEIEPGTYPVMRGEQELGFLALNPPPRESDWTFLNESAVSEQFGINTDNILTADTGALEFSIRKKYEGTPLWKWFVAGAILFLLVEIALIKFWK